MLIVGEQDDVDGTDLFGAQPGPGELAQHEGAGFVRAGLVKGRVGQKGESRIGKTDGGAADKGCADVCHTSMLVRRGHVGQWPVRHQR